MVQASTAEIIPFPKRPTQAMAQKRLENALKNLDVALSEQRDAVARWREAMTDLRESMSSLQLGLRLYRGRLEMLRTGVANLQLQATHLERLAESALPAQR
jgi:uncharacterized coiled-coil protein SlyX